jgi:hypothetical protein
MSRQGILYWYFLSGLIALSLWHCSTEHNIVRLYPEKNGKAPYRQLSTDHYLYVDENHVAEAERGERRVTFVLRSTDTDSARLFARLKLYPEDDFAEPQLELHLKEQILRPAAKLVRREALSEQVTILETGDGIRTNPTIGNDIQAQSGYITFGKPTGAGAAKRDWQVLLFELKLDSNALSAIRQTEALSLLVKSKRKQGNADFSRRQLAAWQRFSAGKSDEVAGE